MYTIQVTCILTKSLKTKYIFWFNKWPYIFYVFLSYKKYIEVKQLEKSAKNVGLPLGISTIIFVVHYLY